MPEADGFELMELIQTGLNLSTPVVMMSTDDGDVRLKSLRSGAAQFLPKPVRPDLLQSLWQVAPGAGAPAAASGSVEGTHPGRSVSLDQLDEAGVAAGLASGAVLLKRRSDELARSAPGDNSGPAAAVNSTRVERLLKERELRRVRSMTGLDADGVTFPTELPSPTPNSMGAREPSADNLAALGEAEPRQRLIVVANRLPVSAKKRADGAWALEVRKRVAELIRTLDSASLTLPLPRLAPAAWSARCSESSRTMTSAGSDGQVRACYGRPVRAAVAHTLPS